MRFHVLSLLAVLLIGATPAWAGQRVDLDYLVRVFPRAGSG